MASTSNKNTAGDYCLQQRSYTDSLKYTEYKYSQAGESLCKCYSLCRSYT